MFWSKEKIFFSCNQCGDCCKDMDVPLSHIDINRLIQANTGFDSEMFITLVQPEEITLDCALLYGSYQELYLTNKLSDNSCIFLKDNKCSIYEYRPNSCRTWPFSKNLKNKLFIDNVASKLVDTSCSKDRFKAHNQVRENINDGINEVKEYREIVKNWNIFVKNNYEIQTLEEFINFFTLKKNINNESSPKQNFRED
ncbi:MAG: YkgJ family cysteine cluster protein [Candidatus Sericytochromatia bacterium]